MNEKGFRFKGKIKYPYTMTSAYTGVPSKNTVTFTVKEDDPWQRQAGLDAYLMIDDLLSLELYLATDPDPDGTDRSRSMANVRLHTFGLMLRKLIKDMIAAKEADKADGVIDEK